METETKDQTPTRTEKEITTDIGEIPFLERQLASSTETEKREIYIALISKFIGLLAKDKTRNPDYNPMIEVNNELELKDKTKTEDPVEYLSDKLHNEFTRMPITQPVITPTRYLDQPAFNVKVDKTTHTFLSLMNQVDAGFKHVVRESNKIDNHLLSAFYIKARMECCRHGLYNPDENFAVDGSDLEKWMKLIDDEISE